MKHITWGILILGVVLCGCSNGTDPLSSLVSSPSSVALAKGGKPASGAGVVDTYVRLVLLDSTDGQAHYGQHVTFDWSTPITSSPFVHNQCFQNGALVLEQWNRMDLGAVSTRTFTLGGSPAWPNGGASCTATLEDWTDYGLTGKVSPITATTFQVVP